jgi:hypothetical protein
LFDDLAKTVILATDGAMVSYTISFLLKSLNGLKIISLTLVVLTFGLNKMKAKSKTWLF